MSRLNDLMAQVASLDPSLAADLSREIRADRPNFGLVFERHRPEAVQLPGRPVRRGDKVRILPPRGTVQADEQADETGDVPEVTSPKDERVWRVSGVKSSKQGRVLSLTLIAGQGQEGVDTETREIAAEDAVVVAEFTDPIYPGLVSTGKVHNGGHKPAHTVITAENFHALKALTFTHAGKVDLIYIDPPYNTRARDWKYNNDYVDARDIYRHSKWLSFMERRLKLAKELLNPADSVLIVTIDEKEVHRLALLLEAMFSEARIQMVSIGISPSGAQREKAFRRSDEYAFFVKFGSAAPTPLELGPEWQGSKGTSKNTLRWNGLLRSGTDTARSDRPDSFYPVLLDAETGEFIGAGEALPRDMPREDYRAPEGTVAVFPIRRDKTEGRWQVGPETLIKLRAKGYVKVGRFRGAATAISYLKAGEQKKVQNGVFGASHIGPDGYVIVEGGADGNESVPTTQWTLVSHSAADHGSSLLTKFIPKRKFPFPKSLYAVEDSLRFFLASKPNAVVLDFFAGSGTTAHAVMRLNAQDDGCRQTISVTNNEVAYKEQLDLMKQGYRPGDPEWEAQGICDYITKPRIRAAITGLTPEGEPIKGNYGFTDIFPLSEGFAENAEFFSLTYETPISVSHNRAFSRIAPLLWMRAGSEGPRIDAIPDEGWAVADTYGVLFDLDMSGAFTATVEATDTVRVAYVITNEERRFQAIAQRLPDSVEAVRLYESYLSNFRFIEGE